MIFKFFLSLLLLVLGCATSPTGRQQLILVSDSQMNQMGEQSFQEIKRTQEVDQSKNVNDFVRCVVGPLTKEAGTGFDNWEVVVFKNAEANAFALPGGRIGVFTGLLKVAQNSAQLAAVIGHEIGHIIARHGAERLSEQAGTQLGLRALGALTHDNPNRNLILGLLGVGAQFGILLPFSRAQENEADLIGLELMAKAGFDPRQSVELWRNMMANSGGKGPPEFLSTHPASENRIRNLQAHMGEALQVYEKSRSPREPCASVVLTR